MGFSSLRLFALLVLLSCATNAPVINDEPQGPQVPILERVVFTSDLTLTWIQDAVKGANCVLERSEFYKEIEKVSSFDETNLDPKTISEKFSTSLEIGKVKTYKTVNPFSNAIAYMCGKNLICMNTRKQIRKNEYNVNTLVHEWTHILGFTHNGNYAKGQENTVPYKAGSIAEKIYKEFCL